MYSRKIKLVTAKKKGKAPNPIGSSWGPRIALQEKEKALSQTDSKVPNLTINQLQHRKQNSYTSSGGQPQHLRNNGECPNPKSNYNQKKVSISTTSSHDGSSLSNKYIYNYARKASTSASSETNKSFFLAPSSTRSNRSLSVDNSSSSTSNINNKNSNSFGGSTYILGSNSGSHVTLSTIGDTVSQPLTLIIPQSDTLSRFQTDFEESHRYNVLKRSQDSFRSTRTYKSSDEEDIDNDNGCELKGIQNGRGTGIATNKAEECNQQTKIQIPGSTNRNPLPGKNEQIFSNPAITLGILKMSTTKPIIHHSRHTKELITNPAPPLPPANSCTTSSNVKATCSAQNQNEKVRPKPNPDATETNNLDNITTKKPLISPEISDLRNICSIKNRDNSTGSTISSLAHGITMVYVPMESLPRSKSAAVLNASLEYDPDISELVNETAAIEISPESPEDFPLQEKDPDNDSLLESFDSIMFKPRDEQGHDSHISPVKSSVASTPPLTHLSPVTLNITNMERIISGNNAKHAFRQRKITVPNTPPPLPPKNPSMLKPNLKVGENKFARIGKSIAFQNNRGCESPQNKNIRVAVANLENIINPSPLQSQFNKDNKPKAKKVTLTLPNEISTAQHDHLFNSRNDTDNEIDAYSSTFLTCGHVLKDDNYSTLSSTHSPRIIDQEDGDVLLPHDSSGSGDCSPSATKEKNRSVIQQLRELSILIGGGNYAENDQLFTQIRNNKDTPILPNQNTSNKSFRLHEEDPTRKLSDATDNSADSGKGSGSGSADSASGSSPKSSHSSPDSLHMKVQKSFKSEVPPACAFRSDCNECLMYNKPPDGFTKPENSEELCANEENPEIKTLRKLSTNSSKRSTMSRIIRRKSSKSSKSSSTKSSKYRKKKPLILDYCECSGCNCGCGPGMGMGMQVHGLKMKELSKFANLGCTKCDETARKISTSSSSSGQSSVKLNRSLAFRNSSRSSTRSKSSPLSNSDLSTNGLFTIEEIEESPSIESKVRRASESQVANFNFNVGRNGNVESVGVGDIDVSRGSPHWHPNCWLAADPMLGWSDLESLYSLNVKNDKPLSINGECWTCWQEISDMKRISENPNGTVDRTKRMFIWLNKRHKEFQAPWWEAKKQASIRWIMTKALTHVPKEYLIDPFKESSKSKPTKYRLRDEVMKGLVSGKLYSLSLANLYQETLGGTGYPAHGLCHWDIIKILSRKGVYVAQPSDMKLTEGTLRQKPIRIAAHIALIEAIMSLYSKEILARERIIATLYSFGCTVKPETTSPEKLVVAWINASVMTLKSYIMSTKNHQLSPEKQNRWLQLPQVGEIRDLCDGIGICSLLAIYCSNDLKVSDISVPDPGDTLTIYDSISNHTLIQKLCDDLFPETIYHLCVTDFLYIHGYMKQNILCFLVDLFIHLEVNPIVRVNRLTHVPIRVELS